MQIEGPIARPLPPESTGANPRRLWLVPPWVIAAIVITIMAALMIPGLLLELGRGF